MTQIKICGLQTLEAAQHALDSGADYLGFIFAPSRRRILPEDARTILEKLPSSARTVGVFMDQPPEEVAEIARYTGIDHIQLHGSETARHYLSAGLPIIRTVPVSPGGQVGSVDLEGCRFALMDTRKDGQAGGSGIPFHWEAARGCRPGLPFFLAGGLHAGNVAEAIGAMTPFAVDVCSGVETGGAKDLDRIRRFVEEVRRIR